MIATIFIFGLRDAWWIVHTFTSKAITTSPQVWQSREPDPPSGYPRSRRPEIFGASPVVALASVPATE